MNSDDFEKQLERLPLRAPSGAWREETLTAARANIRPSPQSDGAGMLTGWRALLARFPVAWGAVTAIWLMIFGVNAWLSGPSPSSTTGGFAATLGSAPSIWSLQRAEMSLLADQFDPVSTTPQRRKEHVPAPRSDRRREDGFGEFDPADRPKSLV